MKVWKHVGEWRTARAARDMTGRSIGFVPTMGALHTGHRALLARARADNDIVVMSVFVNPAQFDDPADLAAYPRTLEADVSLAGGLVDHIIAPEAKDIYPDNYNYRVSEWKLSRTLEGVQRPGHFDGMLTVVLRLLNLVQAQRAYFGAKDWQQLKLVEGMVRAFFLPVEIIACETERDPDGLALSSRNRRLSREARAKAAAFPRALRSAPTAAAAREELQARGFAVDYVEDLDGRRLAAVRIEKVRLIDNVAL